MSNITIGRYDHESIKREWAGWVEPADKAWIIFLDANGKPARYFAERAADGAVIGGGVTV